MAPRNPGAGSPDASGETPPPPPFRPENEGVVRHVSLKTFTVCEDHVKINKKAGEHRGNPRDAEIAEGQGPVSRMG
jgi:hypothetical protein